MAGPNQFTRGVRSLGDFIRRTLYDSLVSLPPENAKRKPPSPYTTPRLGDLPDIARLLVHDLGRHPKKGGLTSREALDTLAHALSLMVQGLLTPVEQPKDRKKDGASGVPEIPRMPPPPQVFTAADPPKSPLRTIIVSGEPGEMGYEIARAAATRGYQIVLTGNTEIADKDRIPGALPIQSDLTDLEQLDQVHEKIVARFSSGLGQVLLVPLVPAELPADDERRTVGPGNMIRAFAPELAATPGGMVVTSRWFGVDPDQKPMNLLDLDPTSLKETRSVCCLTGPVVTEGFLNSRLPYELAVGAVHLFGRADEEMINAMARVTGGLESLGRGIPAEVFQKVFGRMFNDHVLQQGLEDLLRKDPWLDSEDVRRKIALQMEIMSSPTEEDSPETVGRGMAERLVDLDLAVPSKKVADSILDAFEDPTTVSNDGVLRLYGGGTVQRLALFGGVPKAGKMAEVLVLPSVARIRHYAGVTGNTTAVEAGYVPETMIYVAGFEAARAYVNAVEAAARKALPAGTEIALLHDREELNLRRPIRLEEFENGSVRIVQTRKVSGSAGKRRAVQVTNTVINQRGRPIGESVSTFWVIPIKKGAPAASGSPGIFNPDNRQPVMQFNVTGKFIDDYRSPEASNDGNDVHESDEAAKKKGIARGRILHGVATENLAIKALRIADPEKDPSEARRRHTRFVNMTGPGDTLLFYVDGNYEELGSSGQKKTGAIGNRVVVTDQDHHIILEMFEEVPRPPDDVPPLLWHQLNFLKAMEMEGEIDDPALIRDRLIARYGERWVKKGMASLSKKEKITASLEVISAIHEGAIAADQARRDALRTIAGRALSEWVETAKRERERPRGRK